jgi:CMP-N,N'-diacetyllegionaminic acid synthase
VADVLAIVPARTGSKGIPGKNWRQLYGTTPTRRAVDCARSLNQIQTIVVSTDAPNLLPHETGINRIAILHCEPPLHTDTCPMIDVVTDALARVDGPPDQIIVLLQPTQPLREPKHITAAIALLQETQADSVVSVVEVPSMCHPGVVMHIGDHRRASLQSRELLNYHHCCECIDDGLWPLEFPPRRQDLQPMYRRDGTVYAFYRKTVQRFGNIYGQYASPLIIPASETQALDTPEDWAEAERRLRERDAS